MIPAAQPAAANDPEPGPDHDEGPARMLCAATARLLQAAAATAGAVGLGCAGLAALAWLLAPLPAAARPAALAALALLPLERILSLRLRLDAGLFTELARGTAPTRVALASLDRALQALRLRKPAAVQRPLHDRVKGAQRLLAWHLGTVVLQAAALLALLLMLPPTRGPA